MTMVASNLLYITLVLVLGMHLDKVHARPARLKGGVQSTPIYRESSSLKTWERAKVSWADTLQKYDDFNNDQAGRKTKRDSINSVDLSNQNSLVFLANIKLGLTNQVFAMVLDTGSSDTWVRGPDCHPVKTGDKDCEGVKADPTSDTDLLHLPGIDTFTTTYGSGSVTGEIFNGTVTFQTGVRMTIGLSTKSQGFSGGIDGLVGLAFDPLSQISKAGGAAARANFMDQFKEASGNSKNLVGFYISAKSADKGLVSFGEADTSKFTGDIVTFPLNSKTGFWQFDFTKSTVTVGAKAIDLAGSLANAISDTGTSLTILDTEVATLINTELKATFDAAKGLFTFADCTSALAGPDLLISIQGKEFGVPASIYVLGGAGADASPTSCFSGIAGGAKDKAILGDSFLRAYYSVYDKDGLSVGFAKSIDNTSPVASF